MTTKLSYRPVVWTALAIVCVLLTGLGLLATDKSAEAGQPVREHYSLFDSPATDRARQAAVLPSTANLPAFDIEHAQILAEDEAGVVVAAPTTDGPPCIIQILSGPLSGKGGICGPRDGTTALTGYGKGMGLVPDGVTTVTFRLKDGSSQAKPVVDNMWRAPAEADLVTFRIGGEVQAIELSPLSSLPPGTELSVDGVVTPIGKPLGSKAAIR